jgi:hypothetical protein
MTNDGTVTSEAAAFLKRLCSFLKGRFDTAENLGDLPEVDDVPWISASSKEPAKAEYALLAALRGFTEADKTVQSIQAKATTLLTTVLALFVLAGAATILPAKVGQPWPAYAAFAFFVLTDLALLGAAVACFFASGLVLAGGLNLNRLAEGVEASVETLKAKEADAWYYATQIAFWSSHRKAQDLFLARRLVVLALVSAVIGAALLPFGRPLVPDNRSSSNSATEPSPAPKRSSFARE